MNKAFYEENSDFVIKLNMTEDMNASLIFPETRLTIKYGSLVKFLYENNDLTELLLSSIISDIECLLNQGYNNFLGLGHNLILDAVINLQTYDVNWRFCEFLSDKSRQIAMAITAKYVDNYVGVLK